VKRGLELGFRGIKLKTTLEDPNVERLEAIKDAAGEHFHVTVDPNGRLYRYDDAIATIRDMDAVGNMRILEDPFFRHHTEESAALHGKINARVVAHIDPPESLGSVIRRGKIGGLNIDSHTQGLWGWRMQAATADAFNLPVWHGSGLDLGIATAAQLHLAAATPNCELPGDQSGPWLREAHLLKTSFVVENGAIQVPKGVGLGIEVDLAQVERYAVEHFHI
jgi:L-alanine-DL-glutamate epimerase-like enolase superfamily enzyme